MPKFGTKNALFGYFRARILEKFSRIEIWDHKCFIWVFLTKNAIFGYFWARIKKKTIPILEISTLEFV